MTREEAIDSLSVAFGLCKEELNYQIEAIGRLVTQKQKFDEVFKQFNALAKRQYRQPRKSYVSPYAKFDKIRRKRNAPQGGSTANAVCATSVFVAPTSPRKQKRNNHLTQIIMKKRITSLFRKAYNILFRKKTRRTIWGECFKIDSDGIIHVYGDLVVHGYVYGNKSVKNRSSLSENVD